MAKPATQAKPGQAQPRHPARPGASITSAIFAGLTAACYGAIFGFVTTQFTAAFGL